jgi:hypothetical protein
MPDLNASDPTPLADGSPAPSGDDTTQNAAALTPEQQIEGYRKRQAGEAAARAVAESKLAAALAELEPLRAARQTDAQKDLTELARATQRAEEAERRAAEADAKAEARILDAKYPLARKEYAEVVDETKLAKLEALLTEGDLPATPPTPRGNNGQKDTTGDAGQPKPGTIEDAIADLRRFQPNW